MTLNRLTLAAVLLGTMAVPALAQPARHHVRHVSASAHRVSTTPAVTPATPAVATSAPAVTPATPAIGKTPMAAATTPTLGKSAIAAPALTATATQTAASPAAPSPRLTTLPPVQAAPKLN